MSFHRWVTWLLLAAGGLVTPSLAGTDDYILALTGAVALPSGGLKSFTDETSFGGGTLDLRHLAWDSFSWGIYAGLAAFHTRSNNPTDIGSITLGGGDQYRWVSTVPLYVTGHWYPVRSTNGLTVFLGGGIGAARTLRRLDVGWHLVQDDSWNLSGAPEIGILLPTPMEWKLMARLQYHYGLDSGNHWGPRYFSLGIGLAEY